MENNTATNLGDSFEWVFSSKSNRPSRPFAGNREEQENQRFMAKQAFFKALQTFQKKYTPSKSEINFKVSTCNLDRQYALLEKLIQRIQPLLREVKFSISWEHIFMKHHMIHVSCVMTHEQGEVRRCHLALPLSPGKDFSQEQRYRLNAMACAKRYALLTLLGLSKKTDSIPTRERELTGAAKEIPNLATSSVIFLKDSRGVPPTKNDSSMEEEREEGAYQKIVSLYQKKLEKLVLLGLQHQEVKKFIAFGDFIAVGEPSYEEILRYGKRLTQFLQQIEANIYLNSPIFVRGKNPAVSSVSSSLPSPETFFPEKGASEKENSFKSTQGETRVAGFKKVKTKNFSKSVRT